MGTIKKQNRTTFVRCPKDAQHPFNRVPAKLYKLDGYQLAIMAQILSNNDNWNLVKYEIEKRMGFPERKFLTAWRELEKLGYIQMKKMWGSYLYTIYEDPDHTTCTGADCTGHTTGSSTGCTGDILTTTNNNYYNTEESSDQLIIEPVKKVAKEIPDEQNSELHNQFIELYEIYPCDVIRTDGSKNYLKTDRNRCEELYTAYLKEGLLTHDEVMICLKSELRAKKQTGNMKYLKRFDKWLNAREFEGYKDNADKPVFMPYGTELM